MRTRRSETRSRYDFRDIAKERSWNVSHLVEGGDFLEENEIEGYFSDIGLDKKKPDFLVCLGGEPRIIVETKNELSKLDDALCEAIQYAEKINDTKKYSIKIVIGFAGEKEKGIGIETRILGPSGWIKLKANGFSLTNIVTKREAELAISAGDGTTTVTIPAQSEFIDAAIELSKILRTCKVEAPLRPKVMGALVLALYQGEIDITQGNALNSVNNLISQAIKNTGDIEQIKKNKLIESLKLSGSDFDRLEPYMSRIIAILEKLNIRSVLQTDADFLGMFYEAFLRYGFDNNALGIVFTPRHLTSFCASIADVKANDLVIDIASGTGGFLVSAFDKMMSSAGSNSEREKIKSSISGFDTNPTVWALSVLNMFFRGDGKSNIQLADSLNAKTKVNGLGKFTKAFLNPPFSQEEQPEYLFIEKSMEFLQPRGILVAIVYSGIFADDVHKKWRQEFLKKHTLLAMIALPEDVFYPTAAPTSVLVAEAHIPMPKEQKCMMSIVKNDGFRKLKNRRVEVSGDQLPEIQKIFFESKKENYLKSDISCFVKGANMNNGEEWCPHQWLPNINISSSLIGDNERNLRRSIFQTVAAIPDLEKSPLSNFTKQWKTLPNYPLSKEQEVEFFFEIINGKSTGEKNYDFGSVPYISSGDLTNGIIRTVDPNPKEIFHYGGITVSAFGYASVQPWAFVARGNGGSSVRVLIPKFAMNFNDLIWFASQINLQRWRFFYARMAIKSRISRLKIKSPEKRLSSDGDKIFDRVKEFVDTLDKLSSGPTA